MSTTFQNRRANFKAPSIEDTQNYRRQKALDEQKRRRAKRVDSTRQLDVFADLSLGQSDDEEQEDVAIVRTGIASYASLLPPTTLESQPPQSQPPLQANDGSKKKKKKWRPKAKRETVATTSKWADQCMYAELLEMSEEDSWNEAEDGLPDDLDTGWVAVAPIPVGKRCLVVTDQSLGVPGVVPNTCLRSRKLGKLLLPRFPSILPPLTVLDCILDVNWRENGVLHILDVHRWKGQDIGDCETPFRFWWRDTRIAELPLSPPPSSSPKSALSSSENPTSAQLQYRFPYPTRFLPIPYHPETTLRSLAEVIIPLARSSRTLEVQIPRTEPQDISDMAVDQSELVNISTDVLSDGLLLYVSEASYEPGTSPLSSWIPLVDYNAGDNLTASASTSEGPLDIFLRRVLRVGAKKDVSQLPRCEWDGYRIRGFRTGAELASEPITITLSKSEFLEFTSLSNRRTPCKNAGSNM
ncbi:hypothetical protein MIND_01212300 [Mycena indigotica]|uniref:Snurportin-1 n=1 Tax=Mycena indigotica TaxID=2126181 RepID=A0A8H6S456_9AGAR|nr:uncharacterized protein MIND_01212300 [Mycena indigotica]KAF7291870.1 hypothetical protein MIND_01212300 [Mycena indigotica]